MTLSVLYSLFLKLPVSPGELPGHKSGGIGADRCREASFRKKASPGNAGFHLARTVRLIAGTARVLHGDLSVLKRYTSTYYVKFLLFDVGRIGYD